MAYDAVKLVAHAIEIAGPDRTAIRRYLSSLSGTNAFSSLSGPLWFTSANDPVASHFRVARVHDGVLLPVTEQ
jgi:ABC-type branched-subunit amino acid transport system substrate-binding protein